MILAHVRKQLLLVIVENLSLFSHRKSQPHSSMDTTYVLISLAGVGEEIAYAMVGDLKSV